MTDIEDIRARHYERRGVCSHCYLGPLEWPCHTTVALAALDAARADADALRTYARHDPLCNYRPSYPDGPVATCDCGFDAALAAHDANHPPETTANIPLKESR